MCQKWGYTGTAVYHSISGAKINVIDTPGDFAWGSDFTGGWNISKTTNCYSLSMLIWIFLPIFSRGANLMRSAPSRCTSPSFSNYNQDFVNKYHCGNSSMLISWHRGHWAHYVYSYEMVCTYAGDYQKSGRFDLEMKGWGEEDVDLLVLNRVLDKGIEVFGAPDPELIHNWHRKMFNKTSVTNTVG